MSPIITIKEKLDINPEEIKKDLQLDLINFTDFCKEFKFKSDKTSVELLNNNELFKNKTILINENIEINIIKL